MTNCTDYIQNPKNFDKVSSLHYMVESNRILNLFPIVTKEFAFLDTQTKLSRNENQPIKKWYNARPSKNL